jgi:predicted enzyme related to lactoylglutathione lyase
MLKQAKILGVAPQLVVHDVVKTAEYYRDVLGFTILGFFHDSPVYSMVSRDGIEIHFGKADGDVLNLVQHVRKDGVDVIMWVDDIDALLDELKSKQANVGEGIIQRSYGREFIITDCNGYTVAVVS